MNLKYRYRGYIFTYKQVVRRYRKAISNALTDVRLMEREIKSLNGNPFNESRINKLQTTKEAYEAYLKSLYESQSEAKLKLCDLIKGFDEYDSTDHEKAQLLGISHILYAKFLDDHPNAIGSLFASAYLGAETHGERETYIGESEARDNPLFCSAQAGIIELMRTSKEFKQKTDEIFDDVFGALPRYQQVTYSDGSTEMVRMPPNLKAVNSTPT